MFKILLLLWVTLISAFGNNTPNSITVTTQRIETNKPILLSSSTPLFDTSSRYTNKELVSCFPEADDMVYKILSSKQMQMIPRTPFESSTQYSCEYQGSKFSFETPRFEVKEVHYFAKEKLIRLELNDAIALKSVIPNILLYKENNLARTNLQYKIQSHTQNVMILKITEPVGVASVGIEIKVGLSTRTGKRLATAYHQNFTQRVEEVVVLNAKKKAMEFEDKPLMISKEDGSFAIRLFFDDTFYGDPVKKYLLVKGLEHFTLKKDVYLSNTLRQEYNLSHSYYYMDILSDEFKPNTSYHLTIFKGLAHYKQLKETQDFTFKTKDRKKSIRFSQNEPYLSNLGEIGFSSVNVERATVIVEKITPENYRYFIHYTQAELAKVSDFTFEVLSQNVTLDNPKNIIQKQKIALTSMLKSPTAHGVYKVTLKYEDKNLKGEVVEKSASKVVFVSDIGMSVNLSASQAFVSLVRLSDGTPIADAKIALYSTHNILLASALSDKEGIAIIDKKALMSQEPKAIIVSTEDDENFLLLDKPVNSVTKEALNAKVERYQAFVYFQSDIVRPASNIHALIALKDRDFISASKLPVKVVFSERQGRKLYKKVYTTDENGVIDFLYTMENENKTGAYQLDVYLGDKRIGHKIIDVEAFMPPQIANTIQTDKEYYAKDEFIRASLSSSYLFGAPSSFLSAKVHLTAVAFDYTSKDYVGYSFTNESLNASNEQLYLNSEEAIRLDEKGKASVLLSTQTTQTIPSILKATIGLTVMDDTQPVSQYKEVLIYPYQHLVGVKIANTQIETNEAVEGNTVLLDPVTHQKVQRELSVVIKKINWHYSYTKGNYKWEKEIRVVDSFGVLSNDKFSRKMSENGEFMVEVYDRLGGHSSSMTFEVTGWGYSNLSPKEDLKKVEIKFEDKLYSKGDTVKVSLKSPILKGQMLVTLERDKVLWHQTIAIDKGSAQVQIPLKSQLGRGVYIHTTAVRQTDTLPSLIPFRAMSYAFVKPNREAHKIKIALEYDAITPSQTMLPLKIKTDRESALLVSVVDSGILGMTEQKPPEMFDFFNPIPEQQLLYFDLYNEVMHYLTEGTLVAFGAGDTDNEKRKKHLPPANLERVKPFMLWSKILYTKNKEASFDLDIPDFNGKGTIVVMALDKESVGVASGDVVIKDDVMIKPSYPRFLLKGDKIEVPIRLFNTTREPQTLRLKAKVTSNLTYTPHYKEAIEVAPNSSKVVFATLEALKKGSSTVLLETQLKGKIFSKEVSLLVMTPYALQTQTFRNTTSRWRKIIFDEKFEGGKVLVSLSDTILGQLRGDLKYLVGYPYGCAEQTSSKIASMFYAKPFMKKDKLLGDADNFIRQGVKKLSRMQNSYGEFSYWKEGGYVNSYASLYASETLLALDKAGFTLDKTVKKKTIEALSAIAKGVKLSVKFNQFEQVYAGYILSLYGKLDESTMNLLYDKKIYKEYYLSWYYMAGIFKNMNRESLSDEVYKGVANITLAQLKEVKYRPTGFPSESRDMFFIFYMNSTYFKTDKNDFETVKKQFSKLYSTHEKALAFKAMSAYLGRAIDQEMKLNLTLNHEKIWYDESVAFTDMLTDSTVTISPLSGVVNYSIEAYKPLPFETKNELNFTDTPLSLTREFVNGKNEQVNLKALTQGEKIYATVTLKSNEAMNNIVLNYRIPACMDIVNTRIAKGTQTLFKDTNLLLDYKDIRDDRVLYFLHTPQPKKDNQKRVLPTYTTIYIPLMVTTVGECQLPALTVEAMYNSRVNDYVQEMQTIVVTSAHSSKSKPRLSQGKSIKEIESKVKEFYLLEAKSQNPQDFVGLFHYPITRYFNKSNFSKAQMLEDKAKYNKSWSHKTYTIKEVRVTTQNRADKTTQVKIVFDYKLENKSGKSIQGTSRHLMTLKEYEGSLLVDKIEIF